MTQYIRQSLAIESSIDGNDGKVKRGLQHFLSLRPDASLRREYESLMRFSLDAEKLCPGGGLGFLRKVSGHGETLQPTPKNKQEIVDLLERRGYSPRVLDMLLECLNHSSVSTKLSIRKSATSNSYVEITEGYTFDARPLFKTLPTEMKNAVIIAIDGYVEAVSEIHHLLEELSIKKLPCVILVRGMSDDVVHTLKVNFDRKTLLVVPFVVPYDVENVNTLVDVAVVSGGDVVSSLKGDLISSIELSKIKSVESCLVSGGGIRIRNRSTRISVKNHIENIKRTIEERQEIAEVLGKRLRSLTSSCIDVYIPNDVNFFSMSQQLDEGIRIISSVLSGNYNPKTTIDNVFESYQKTMSDVRVFTLCEK